MKLNNKYYILRHGEAISNTKDIVSSWPEKFNNHLTKKGRGQIKKTAKELKNKNIDMIFASDLLRTKQTAEIISWALKIKPKFDKRLREMNFGKLSNGPIDSVWNYFKNEKERIKKAPPKGENYLKILDRMSGFLKNTDKRYKDKNILIISHEAPLFILEGWIRKFSPLETIKNYPSEKRIHKGEVRELN